MHLAERASTPKGPCSHKGGRFGADDWLGVDGSVVALGGKRCPTCPGAPAVKWAGSRPHTYLTAPTGSWTETGACTALSAPPPGAPGRADERGPAALRRHDSITRIVRSSGA